MGLGRSTTLRDSDAMARRQVVDVQFADLIRDPFTTIRSLNAELGRELESVAEKNTRAYLDAHPATVAAAAIRGPTPDSTPHSSGNRHARTGSATGLATAG